MTQTNMDLKEVQAILYNLLCITADFCEEKNLEYHLCGGTLLGAIRHNGFIPWDDDIDIFLKREDYEKLKRYSKDGTFSHPYAKIMVPGDEGYPYPFIKVYDTRTYIIDEGKNPKFDICMNIDIFPLDHFADNNLKHKKDYLVNRVLRAALAVELVDSGLNLSAPVKAVARGINKMLGGYRGVCRVMDRTAGRMHKRNVRSHYAGDGPWPESMKDYFHMDHLYPLKKHIFVDREFWIPGNYDAVLSWFYGDYMTPPPPEKRARHSFKAYWRKEQA